MRLLWHRESLITQALAGAGPAWARFWGDNRYAGPLSSQPLAALIRDKDPSVFSKRGGLGGSREYSREFLEAFLADLSRAGFDQIEMMLPHNLVGIEQHIVSPRDYLDRERNYPSVILRATDSSKRETLKVLFVNRSSKAAFFDDTFPSGESARPGLYFQSPDPGRTYSVFQFFYEYLTGPGTATIPAALGMLATLALAFEALGLVFERNGAIASTWGQSIAWDVALIIASAVLVFAYYASRRGLWVKPRREIRLLQLANMALRGELRDNPLVSLIITVLGTVIGAIILNWLGVL